MACMNGCISEFICCNFSFSNVSYSSDAVNVSNTGNASNVDNFSDVCIFSNSGSFSNTGIISNVSNINTCNKYIGNMSSASNFSKY